MATYDINLWVSERLYNEMDNNTPFSPMRPGEVAKVYLEGAFNKWSDNADVTLQPEHPLPPDGDGVQKSQNASVPCTGDTKTYNTTWHWWRSRVNADCRSYQKANDVNFLLLKGTGGGLGAGRIAAASVGSVIAPLSKSYNEFGQGDAHNGIDTVQEEAQHCMIDAYTDQGGSKSDADGDGSGHDYGKIDYDSTTGIYGVTPNGVTGSSNYNNCGYHQDKNNQNGYAHYWSNCAMSHMSTR